MADTKASNAELKQLEHEITDAKARGDIERMQRIERVYMDVVHTGREMTAIEMVDFVVQYLTDPKAGEWPIVGRNMDDFPSLMEVADGNEHTAAGYVICMMKWADQDDITFNIRRACEECEKAFASMIHLNGEDRFR
jgi:hypothetical protein